MRIGMKRSQRHRRIVTAATSAALLALVAAGCSSASTAASSGASNKSPVVLSVISDTVTGVDNGIYWHDAAVAAASYINKDLGGFGGRQVKILYCNPLGDPAGTAVCAHQAIQAGAVTTLGLSLDWATTGAPVFIQSGRIYMTLPLSPQDLTSKWSYSLGAAGATEYAAQAEFICSKHPKSVAILAIDVPVNHTQLAPQVATLEGCGVKVDEIFTNPATADFTPYVNKAVQAKPDFVLINYGIQQSILVVKALQAAGIPGSAMMSQGSVVDPSFFSAIGSDLEGSYYTYESYNWNDTGNADVALYLKEMAEYGSGIGAQNENSQLSFATVMTLYDIAKQIGFANFNYASLAKYVRTTPDIPAFMSKSIINPSPVSQYPGIHQPYVQILQYTNGSLQKVLSTNGGWMNPWTS